MAIKMYKQIGKFKTHIKMMNSKCIYDLYSGYKVYLGYKVANPLNLVAFTIKITNYNR